METPSIYRDEQNRRCVHPYTHSFQAFCKARWIGCSLLSVFVREFLSHDEEYFRRAIASGCITVNGRVSSVDHLLRDGDKIVHCLHRHEPPVPGDPLLVLPSNGPFLAICKPAGVPTHACGAFNHLSVPNILFQEAGHPVGSLYTVHRLDRLTSGVLLLGRTKEEACAVSALLRGAPGSGVIRKRYFALVEGSFPRFSGDSVASHAPGGFCNEENSLCFDSSFPGFPFYDFEVHGSPLRVRVQELGSIDVDPVSPTQPPCPWISSFRPQPGFASLSENGNTAGGTARENDQGGKGRKRVRNEEGYTEGTFTPNDPTASKEDNVKLSPKSNLPIPNPPLAWTSHGYLRVDVPLRTLDEKNALQGVAAAGEGGGESCTLFKFVGEVTRRPPSGSHVQYPPLTLVQCLPLSGRSHQIRVHLAYLGFPIWDDPLYSPSAAKELEKRVEAEGKRERGGAVRESTLFSYKERMGLLGKTCKQPFLPFVATAHEEATGPSSLPAKGLFNQFRCILPSTPLGLNPRMERGQLKKVRCGM